MTLLTILLAVYFTGLQQVKAHVAVIAQDSSTVLQQSNPQLDMTIVQQKPPHSDLVKQKYDAYLTINPDGTYSIETLRSKEFQNMLDLLLQHPDASIPQSGGERGAGVNIIGFMMMFMLMLSFSNLFAFADDKEQGQIKRIIAAPSSFWGYLAAHCAYCVIMASPAFLMIAVLKWCGWKVGFTLLQYAGLTLVLSILGISFAFLLNTLIKKPDNASMLGSATTVLTTILAGGFYSFSKSNAVIDPIIKLLPQKELLNFAQYLQNGDAGQHLFSILYVIGFSCFLFAVSCYLLRRMYIRQT
jgi:ABC-2 type transport system permease protein